MKAVAIIQARMGSSRLPGKMLKDLAGKPLIWHLIHRLQRCANIDEIVLATTTDKDDDALFTFGKEAGLKVVRGEASDVLGRFALGAEVSGADIIVRVNGDAPLIDARFIDAQVAALKAQDADFVTLAEGTPCVHDGVDAMSRRSLDLMMAQAREDPVAREHVSGYIKHHPDKFKIGFFEIPEELQWDGARLSIDTPADLAFMERLYVELGAAPGEASLADASKLLQARPDLVVLNAHVKQKAPTEVHGTVLIRVDGGGRLGFGHVMRTLAIGSVLRDELGYGVVFAMDGAGDLADGTDYVEAQGFPVKRRGDAKEVDWLLGVCKEKKPGSVLFDIRTDLSASDVTRIRKQVEKVVTLDDGSDRRLVADVAILPPVPQVQAMDWTGAKGEVIADWDHVVLSSGALGPQARRDGGPVKLLVNFGGSDPFGLTLPAAKLVAKLGREVETTFVFGPGVGDVAARAREVEACSPDFNVLAAPDNFAALAASQDLALIAYGVTAWELAHAGVPSILICLDDDQFASAGAFEREGIASRALMVPAKGGKGAMPDIQATLTAWLKDPKKRQKAGKESASLVDGNGTFRVAATMLWGQTPDD